MNNYNYIIVQKYISPIKKGHQAFRRAFFDFLNLLEIQVVSRVHELNPPFHRILSFF